MGSLYSVKFNFILQKGIIDFLPFTTSAAITINASRGRRQTPRVLRYPRATQTLLF